MANPVSDGKIGQQGKRRTIGIIVVHGVGSQRVQETVEQVALNFYQALKTAEGVDNVEKDLHPECPFQPVTLDFLCKNSLFSIRFYEVYYADLDRPYNFLRWVKLVLWGLILPFYPGRYEEIQGTDARMKNIEVSLGTRLWVRFQLAILSVIFIFLLFTLRALTFVIYRVFGKRPRLGEFIHEYLGDVQLFVSERIRQDTIETYDKKSREAMRVRFWNTYGRACLEDNEEIILITHSLGTVVTFNALMEPGDRILEQYVTDRELREKLIHLWKGNGSSKREKVLNKLKAWFALGSPLDKFAAIWPRTIPINVDKSDPPVAIAGQPQTAIHYQRQIPWINVHDILDIIGAKLNNFAALQDKGFHLKNHPLVDRWTFLTAHTSYWHHIVKEKRLINSILEYIISPADRREFSLPGARKSKAARIILNLALGSILVYATAWITVSFIAWVITSDTSGIWGAFRPIWDYLWERVSPSFVLSIGFIISLLGLFVSLLLSGLCKLSTRVKRWLDP
ncbi:MAG: hypothetical protein HYY45_02315 [Deltaproteobacteria bacterium]|nr:hypothetical protein [Deltaproteobacteria bacterium]